MRKSDRQRVKRPRRKIIHTCSRWATTGSAKVEAGLRRGWRDAEVSNPLEKPSGGEEETTRSRLMARAPDVKE